MDGKKYLRNFGITLAILCCLNVGNWLLTAVFNFPMPTFVRYMTIYLAVFLACILMPAKAFGDINLPREGVRYAMLPVSNLEKYLSYLLYGVMTPVVIVLLSYGIDSLLTLLPVGGFQHYIKSLGIMGTTMDFMEEMGALAADPSLGDVSDLLDMMHKIGSVEVWNYIVGILFTMGIFMMGNLLFKHHKTGITFAIMMCFSYVVSTISQLLLFSSNVREFLVPDPDNFDFGKLGEMTSGMMLTSVILYALLTIALYTGIFFKLKTQKY